MSTALNGIQLQEKKRGKKNLKQSVLPTQSSRGVQSALQRENMCKYRQHGWTTGEHSLGLMLANLSWPSTICCGSTCVIEAVQKVQLIWCFLLHLSRHFALWWRRIDRIKERSGWYLQDVGDHSNGPAVHCFAVGLLSQDLWSWKTGCETIKRFNETVRKKKKHPDVYMQLHQNHTWAQFTVGNLDFRIPTTLWA